MGCHSRVSRSKWSLLWEKESRQLVEKSYNVGSLHKAEECLSGHFY